MQQFDVIIVGGGSAGISVAARLRREAPALTVAIIDPAHQHYYQPLFTLVGAGASALEETVRPMASLMPAGVQWIQERVNEFLPQENSVVTDKARYEYAQLVVAPGIQLNWNGIEGLKDTLGKNGVCSNYAPETVMSTWDALQKFSGGNAIFTFPATPVKCAGAPQKIMYLAEHFFRRRGVRDKADIYFASAGATIFGVKKYAAALTEVMKDRGITPLFRHNLIAVDGARREATFRHMDEQKTITMPFSLLHVTPPMSAPDFVRQSPLANADGWVDVDKHTLQHARFKNIFSLGDASSLPTSKTAAAIRKQAPILVSNLLASRANKTLDARYDGYTSCPLVTGYGRLILAEFDYDCQPREMFPFDQSKERLSMYLLKKYVLPPLYWQGMMKGLA